MNGGVRADTALDRDVRDIALVPKRDVFHRRHHGHAHKARQAGQVFGQHRVALVRHGGRALLALREELFGFQHLGALHVADFGRDVFDADEAITPSVAKNIAWRSRGITWVLIGSGVRPSLSQTCASTAGSMLANVPTAPEMAPVAISCAGSLQTRKAAVHFGVEAGKGQTHCDGFGVNAVAAPDADVHLVLDRAGLQRGQQGLPYRRSEYQRRAQAAH